MLIAIIRGLMKIARPEGRLPGGTFRALVLDPVSLTRIPSAEFS